MLWSIDSCENRVSADQYQLTVSRAQVLTHRGQVLFEVIRWQVTSFQMIAGSSQFFLIDMKYVVFCMCRTIKMLISNWPRKLKFSQFLQAGKTCQLLLTFLTKVTRWSRSTSNFYALIGQNLTGEFMRKIYAASWNLFTFDSWSWQSFVSTCDVFFMSFSTGCTKWNTAAIKSLLLFMAGLFIGFLVEKCIACQNSVIRFPTASFSFFTLLNA